MQRRSMVCVLTFAAALWGCGIACAAVDAGKKPNEKPSGAPQLARPKKAESEPAGESSSIRIPAKVVTWQDDRDAHLAWARRALVEPFQKRLKGKATDAAARAFVDRAIVAWTASALGQPGATAALADEGRRLMAQGCDEPLPVFLAGWADYAIYRDWRALTGPGAKALKIILADRSVDAVVGSLFLDWWAFILECNFKDSHALREQAATRFRDSLTKGNYSEKEDAIFVCHQLRRLTPLLSADQLRKLKAPCLTAWARHTLLGVAEVQAAWKQRGGGWAGSVTEEGWKGFREHLAVAREELTQAWKLRPDRPEAAAAMIEVVMAGSRGDGETERLWFDRAIAAQFDCRDAYKKILWAYRPRWGGSHEKMLAFGRACLATRRYDTEVPLRFFDACNDVASELDAPRELYRRPEVAKPLLELSQALVNEPARQAERPLRLSGLAVNAWLAGDYVLSARALAAVDEKLHPVAVEKLKRYHSELATFPAEVAVLASSGRADFEEAEKLSRDEEFDAAEAAYRRAGQKSGPRGKKVIDSRLAAMDFERRLDKGQWAKIAVDPSLAQWDVRQGQWSADRDGVLVLRGNDGPARILYRGRVGGEFEMRGDADIAAKQNCCRALGVALAWRENATGEGGLTCAVYQGGYSPFMRLLSANDYYINENVKDVSLGNANHFFVRCRGDRLTFRVNYCTVFADYQPKESVRLNVPEGLIGFNCWRCCSQNTTTFRNIEIRRLPSEKDVILDDMKASAKATWGLSADRKPTLDIALRLEGAAAAQASACGEVKVESILDGRGNTLEASPAASGRGGPSPLAPIARSDRQRADPGALVLLNVSKPGAVESLRELKGSVALRTGGRLETVVVKDLAKRLGAAIDDPALKAAGIAVAATREASAKGGKESRPAAAGERLAIECRWDSDPVVGCELLDAQGQAVATANAVVEASADKVVFRIALPGRLPARLDLRLTLHCDPQTVRVPFALEDIAIPPPPKAAEKPPLR